MSHPKLDCFTLLRVLEKPTYLSHQIAHLIGIRETGYSIEKEGSFLLFIQDDDEWSSHESGIFLFGCQTDDSIAVHLFGDMRYSSMRAHFSQMKRDYLCSIREGWYDENPISHLMSRQEVKSLNVWVSHLEIMGTDFETIYPEDG